eukprot:1149900-Pelagomonas_calceolata.AAC.6
MGCTLDVTVGPGIIKQDLWRGLCPHPAAWPFPAGAIALPLQQALSTAWPLGLSSSWLDMSWLKELLTEDARHAALCAGQPGWL